MFTSRRTDLSVQDINNLPSREWQIIEQEKIPITFKNISPYSEGTVSQNRKKYLTTVNRKRMSFIQPFASHQCALGVSLVAQTVKNLPAMQEAWVQSLGWEDSTEEGMATHPSILSCRISMDRGAWRATVHGVTKSQTQLSD